MSFRYNFAEILLKKIYRKIFPVPKSPYTTGYVQDICTVNLIPPKDLQEFFTRSISLLKTIKGDDIGDYLEFGVFNGKSMISMYKSCKELGITDTRFIGFDSFEGLPSNATDEDNGVWSKGMYSCSFEDLKRCLLLEKINTQEITLIKGWYQDTLNQETRNKLQLKNISIVFVDCDTYSSSKTVLDFIAPLINQPILICFDDWKLNDLDIQGLGEYKAFNEFLENNPTIIAQPVKSYNRKSKSFLVKPKHY